MVWDGMGVWVIAAAVVGVGSGDVSKTNDRNKEVIFSALVDGNLNSK